MSETKWSRNLEIRKVGYFCDIPGGTYEISSPNESFWAAHALRLENAQLYVAAPELYEALEAALHGLAHSTECVRIPPTEQWGQKGSIDFGNCKCVIAKVNAALAKARGETA